MTPRPICYWFILVVMLGTTTAAQADSRRERAGKHVEAGERYQELGDFDKAIVEYEAAYAIVPHHALLFNLGQAHRLNGDKETALDYYERFLAIESDTALAEKAGRYARLLRDAIEKQSASAATATATAPAVPEDKAADEPRTKASAELPAEGAHERFGTSDKGAGSNRPVQSSPVEVTMPEPRDSQPRRGLRRPGYITAGVGVLFLLIGVSGGLNEEPFTENSSLECDEYGDCNTTGSTVAYILGAGGVIVGGTLVVLSYSGGGDKKVASSAPGSNDRAIVWAPAFDGERAGLVVSGRF